MGVTESSKSSKRKDCEEVKTYLKTPRSIDMWRFASSKSKPLFPHVKAKVMMNLGKSRQHHVEQFCIPNSFTYADIKREIRDHLKNFLNRGTMDLSLCLFCRYGYHHMYRGHRYYQTLE